MGLGVTHPAPSYSERSDMTDNTTTDKAGTDPHSRCGGRHPTLGETKRCPLRFCAGCGEDLSLVEIHLCDYPTEATYQEELQ